MFNTDDLAALPTNIALTLWDALPVLLAVGASISIVAATILPDRWREFWWTNRRIIPIEGVVLLGIFSWGTAAVHVTLSAAAIVVATRAALPSGNTQPAPATPLSTVKKHAGDLLGQALLSAVIVGAFEIILRPSVDVPDPAWAVIIGTIIVVLRISPAAASVVALTFVAGTELTVATALVLAISFAGELIVHLRSTSDYVT